MPQFKPLWWINLLSWMFCIIGIITRYNHAVNFPSTIRIIIARISI
jgi:hypothetical protein